MTDLEDILLEYLLTSTQLLEKVRGVYPPQHVGGLGIHESVKDQINANNDLLEKHYVNDD